MKKTLLRFQDRLLTINKPQAKFYFQQMAKCLHSIRGKVKHHESGHTTVLSLNSHQISGDLSCHARENTGIPVNHGVIPH